uniref:Uncharacterized protein n=1 Tax=Myotis myotis TaxID=51298 RepID=A0A7J7S264_MYOMY|nr:hypothetical protein mMyoMyo1_010117 [Myotis myotis]
MCKCGLCASVHVCGAMCNCGIYASVAHTQVWHMCKCGLYVSSCVCGPCVTVVHASTVHVHVFTVALFFTKMVDFARPLDFLGERHPEWDLGLVNGLGGLQESTDEVQCREPVHPCCFKGPGIYGILFLICLLTFLALCVLTKVTSLRKVISPGRDFPLKLGRE